MDSVAAFFSPAVITKTSAQWEMTLGPKTENSILKKKNSFPSMDAYHNSKQRCKKHL